MEPKNTTSTANGTKSVSTDKAVDMVELKAQLKAELIAELKKDSTALVSSTTTKCVVPEEIYLYSKEVRIRPKEKKSLYVLKNLASLPAGKRDIGASITSSQQMLVNFNELKVYMPSIIGVSPTHQDFYSKVKNYFDAIAVTVPDNDLKLNCSFRFNSKRDYENYISQVDDILSKFSSSSKGNAESRNTAFKVRDNSLIALESKQYLYGMPVVVTDYILYRYCLHYALVANDLSLINANGNINFYIVDAKLEETRKEYQHNLREKAMSIYNTISNDTTKLSNVLYASGVVNVDKLSAIDKSDLLYGMLNNAPDKLLLLGNDKKLSDKALIERLIQRGLIKRYPNTNMILNSDDETIGNNMSETVAYINNPLNKSVVSNWRNMLSSY